MRISKLKHPLAVLRQIIGIGQKEMAKLIGRSTRTIQAIELLTLKLSDDLADRISHETGVSVGWLIAGDPHAPIVALDGKPYFPSHYEETRIKHSVTIWEDDIRGVVNSLNLYFGAILAMNLTALKNDQIHLFNFKALAAVNELGRQFKVPKSLLNKFLAAPRLAPFKSLEFQIGVFLEELSRIVDAQAKRPSSK